LTWSAAWEPLRASPLQALRNTTLVACAIYVALLPTNDATFIRSWTLGIGCLSALVETTIAARARKPLPSPGGFVLVALLLWGAWVMVSWTWSIDRPYTLSQIEREALQTGLAIGLVYATSRDDRSFRVLAGATIGSFVFFAALGSGMALTDAGWRPEYWHYDFGIWSTYVVLVAPMLFMLLIPRPFGFGNGVRSLVVAGSIVALLVASLLMTGNRIAWPALGISISIAAVAIRIRFRDSPRRVVLRWFLPVAALLVMLTVAFVDAARDRAHRIYPGVSVLRTFEIDPRIQLWQLSLEWIAQRPVLGYGFGRRILGDELVRQTDNRLMNHPHDLMLSIWMQTGVIGVLLFGSFLVALVARYVSFIRQVDRRLALAGILGVAIVCGFLIKNLTDDFFYRSNAKEFFVLNAILIGYGARLTRGAGVSDVTARTADRACGAGAIPRAASADLRDAMEARASAPVEQSRRCADSSARR
jgi:O-antigen ligase